MLEENGEPITPNLGYEYEKRQITSKEKHVINGRQKTVYPLTEYGVSVS